MLPFGIFDIVEDHSLTDTESIEVKRTFQERFFSWPWKPWKKTRIEYFQVPKKEIYLLNGRTIVCHPAMAMELRLQIEDIEST